MSTSFYVTRKLTETELVDATELLLKQEHPLLRDMLPEPIEICHRADGWQLLWYAHGFKYYKDINTLLKFLDENQITDEYGNKYTLKEFLIEVSRSLYSGMTYEEYYKTHTSEFYPHNVTTPNVNANRYGEFFIDGLRFVDDYETR